jgi:class 3 adenylate cyclase
LVRIGLHTGEAIKEADDFHGKNVILAARIAGQAQGGQILVSSLLKELTESAGEFQFAQGRELGLKGLAGLTRVYHVVWQ